MGRLVGSGGDGTFTTGDGWAALGVGEGWWTTLGPLHETVRRIATTDARRTLMQEKRCEPRSVTKLVPRVCPFEA